MEGAHKSWVTGQLNFFFIVVTNSFSTITVVFCPLHIRKCVNSHILGRKGQITVKFTRHSRIVGPQYRTFFVLPL